MYHFDKVENGIKAVLIQGKSLEWCKKNHREFYEKNKNSLQYLARHNYNQCDSVVKTAEHVNEK